jgi:hypothetical protein
MNLFKTPEEAITACDAECLVTWSKFAAVNHIKPEIDEVAYEIAKNVFSAGFMSGAKFVTGHLVSSLQRPNWGATPQSP